MSDPHHLTPQLRVVVLAEAAWLGDDVACEKYGISRRTIQRLRRTVGTDIALLQALEVKKKLFEQRWLEDLDTSLGSAIRTINTCAQEVAKDIRAAKNPDVIKALSSAIKLLADVKLANRVITARLESLGPMAVDESHQLAPGEIEIAPGVVIMAPEVLEVEGVQTFTTETPSIVEMALDSQDHHPEA